jgi:hypothetical protein
MLAKYGMIMLASHSFLNKSRAILICLLVIGSFAEVGAYYYVQNYTSYSKASPIISSFQVGNLTVDPYEALINHAVNISVGVVNLANSQGSYSLSLKINDTIEETKKLAFSANESQLVSFSVTETNVGSYNVSLGDQLGLFTVVRTPTPMPSTLHVNKMNINPVEGWPSQLINASIDVSNAGNDTISYSLPFSVNGQVDQHIQVDLPAGASTTLNATLIKENTGNYQLTVGGRTGHFTIVPTGQHTLHVILNQDGAPFTLDGTPHTSPYTSLVNVGPHQLELQANILVPKSGWGLVNFVFTSSNDGSTSLSKTVDVEDAVYVTANYVRTQNSCPVLSTWNGINYNFIADVNDGTGWLGFLEYFKPDGSMVFSYNYPYDYIKLGSNQLQPLNGVYNFQISETQNEIFYLDSVKLLAVDHPSNTDVFSTRSTFVYNLAGQGTIYTVSKNSVTPISAVNGKGQNVMPLISNLDNNFTSATRWTWNNITLNLGNLANAKQINLVVGAKIVWPSTSSGGSNFMSYANKPGVMPSPPPYMEVKAENGSWIRVPDSREFPIPSTSDQIFVVNLTGLFPSNNYELRINYYQDVEFDYIGVDTTQQQNTIVHTVTASCANLQQAFSTNSTSTGAFTRYGDVKSLLQSTDDQFVVGREGDQVSLQFPANFPPIPQGMVRDYFVVTNCWFKGLGLPYVPFTVDPLPFQSMTSFPYPSTESYPTDLIHQAYLKTFNTRIINTPKN